MTRLVSTIATSRGNPEDAQKYRVGHHATQARKEVGAAISKYASEVTMKQFVDMLDMYDGSKGPQLTSPVPEPVEMIRKLEEGIARKKKRKTTQEEAETTGAQRACRDFLNGLIELLPST